MLTPHKKGLEPIKLRKGSETYICVKGLEDKERDAAVMQLSELTKETGPIRACSGSVVNYSK